MKTKTLASSVLAIVLCLSLITGATFALFTSSSETNVAVTSGKVNVVATATTPTIEWDERLAENMNETMNPIVSVVGNVVRLEKLVPGVTVKFDIEIQNKSDVTILYRTIIKMVDDDGLWDGLNVTIGGNLFNGETKKSEWTTLAFGQTIDKVTVEIEFPYEADNRYQEKSCQFAYLIEAVQGNADMPSEWDGETVTEPRKDDQGVYHITNSAEFVWMMLDSNGAAARTAAVHSVSENTKNAIILERDIDLGGATITGFGSDINHFALDFDGNGHSISNFKIDRSTGTNEGYYAGLFNYVYGATIKNLTVKNATVTGDQMVGALIGSIGDGATVENCTVEDCTVNGYRKVGGAVGYANDAIVKGISVKNTAVCCGVTVQSHGIDQWGEVIGYKNTALVESGNTAENVTISFVAYVGTFEQLSAAVNNQEISKIILTADIVNETVPHTGGTTAYDPYQTADTYTLEKGRNLTIDFNGHILTTPVRLFYVKGGATLTLENNSASGAQSGIYFNKVDSDPNYGKNAYGIYLEIERKNQGSNWWTESIGVLNIEKNVTIGMGIEDAAAQPQCIIWNCGNVNMNGGELIAYATTAVYIFSSAEGDFKMNGGKITLGDESAIGIYSFVNSNAEVELMKGSIVGKGTAYQIVGFNSSYKFNISEDFVINTAKGPNS